MPRPVTLFVGQWADLDSETMFKMAADMGYDGVELACWGDFFDVQKAAADPAYCAMKWSQLKAAGLNCWAISNHLVGQAVCDLIDARHQTILAPHIWGDGDPEGVRQRAAEEMKTTARAAANMDLKIVCGFTGSSIWHLLYSFPPNDPKMIEAGFQDFADRWNPILDVFDEVGVKFALEVHPTEIAYDIWSAEMALDAIGRRPAFGFNFDPSHLIWQGMNPAKFVDRFADRIYHVHIKDASVTLDGESGILASHLNFGDHRRGWDFRSPDRGSVNFQDIIRALNRASYSGPLSVEWEDSGMQREQGALEACQFVRKLDFAPSTIAFDAQFAEH